MGVTLDTEDRCITWLQWDQDGSHHFEVVFVIFLITSPVLANFNLDSIRHDLRSQLWLIYHKLSSIWHTLIKIDSRHHLRINFILYLPPIPPFQCYTPSNTFPIVFLTNHPIQILPITSQPCTTSFTTPPYFNSHTIPAYSPTYPSNTLNTTKTWPLFGYLFTAPTIWSYFLTFNLKPIKNASELDQI